MSDLFGELPPLAVPAVTERRAKPKGRRAATVEPATPAPELLALASRLRGRHGQRLRLGTSSWYFPGWAGFVWSEAAREFADTKVSREGLRAYAQHPLLQTVSLDRAFYEPLREDTMRRYAEQVGADFRFTCKCWRGLTDPVIERAPNPLFLDADYGREQVLGPFLAGAGDKAGVLVLQFSPGLPQRARFSAQAFADRLGDFLHRLHSPIPVAIELRDAELLTPEYFAAVAAHGAVHCVNVHPASGLSVIEQVRRIGARPEPLVIRWMLHAGFAYEEARERYSPFTKLVDEDPTTRNAIARIASRALKAGGRVTIIANNKAEGSAPLTLFALAAEIDRLDEPAP